MKQTVTVDGQLVEYTVSGHGTPAIVLINGGGGPIEGWQRVWQPLAAMSCVFAYNRAGIGRSSKPVVPQSGTRLVATLRAVLSAAAVPAPYVLVAHSLGGLVANLYARQHPHEVAAVVLLEATAPEDPAALARHESRLQRLLRTGLHRLLPSSPNDEVNQVHTTVAELARAPVFPPLPLTVVSGGAPAMVWATPAQVLALRAQHQRQLASLSPLGRQVMAARSGHFPQLSEPAVVVDAVRAELARCQVSTVPTAATPHSAPAPSAPAP